MPPVRARWLLTLPRARPSRRPISRSLSPHRSQLPDPSSSPRSGHSPLASPHLPDRQRAADSLGGAARRRAVAARAVRAAAGADRRPGRRAPVLLVIEDLHWADRSTRDFVAFLIRNARARSGSRSWPPTARTSCTAAIRCARSWPRPSARPPSRAVCARGLHARGAAQPARRHPRPPPRRAPGGRPVRARGGQPVLHRGARGRRRPRRAAAGERARRADGAHRGAGPDAQAVLRVAAAAGRACATSCSSAPPACRRHAARRPARGGRHHVARPRPGDGGLRFRHALLREALLDDLLPGERGPLHGALARALAYDPSLSAPRRRGRRAGLPLVGRARPPGGVHRLLRGRRGPSAAAAFAEANAPLRARAPSCGTRCPTPKRAPDASTRALLRAAGEGVPLRRGPRPCRGAAHRRAERRGRRRPDRRRARATRLGRCLWATAKPAGRSRPAPPSS